METSVWDEVGRNRHPATCSDAMPFDKYIVDEAAAPVHRDADAGRRQHASELTAGELAALVGVENLQLAEPGECLLQRTETERDILCSTAATPGRLGSPKQ
jgi:hypothetical protein